MSYSDKVQAAVNSAHETAIANKIIDMMQELKLKNDEKTACRWIWELIQNAKDVADETGGINIEIEFNEKEKYLAFKHDGKYFTTDNIVHLISQVSSKERNLDSDSAVTGKFGTGFLTTHLLSERVKVKAYLKDEDEPLKKIDILLDRSGETKEEVIAAVNESFRQLESSQEMNTSVSSENRGFDTCFFYELDNNGIETAQNGLENLYISIPYVFAFVDKVNSIRVNHSFGVQRGEKRVVGNMEVHSVYITDSESIRVNEILLYHGENVDLAIPIKREDDEVLVEEYPHRIPKLFCTFPLIGTEDFSFPVIVNSTSFNPNEPRSGIYLTDKENKVIDENKSLILQALNSYKDLLDYAASHNWKQLYNIVHVPKQSDKDWLSRDWFDSLIEDCKAHIKNAPIFDTISGERKALFDFCDCQDVLILGDSEKTTRELVWEMGKSIYPDHMALFSEIHRWYASLWVECRNFGVKKLVREVEEFGNLEGLEKTIKDQVNSIDWLNRLYGILVTTKNTEILESAEIFPNQLGQFCDINKLYVDEGIDDVYIQILSLLDHDCREYLLNKKIELPENLAYGVYNYDMLFDEILEAMDSDHFSEQEAMAKLIVLYDEQSENDEEQINLLSLLEGLFLEQLPDDCKVKKVNAEIMERARKYWCTEMADRVSEYGDVDTLTHYLKLKEDESVWSWLGRFIEYLEKYKHKNLLERKTKPILPNQKGEFITLEGIFLDSGEIDEFFKDIVCEIGDDIRGILLPADICLELPESRVKRLKDVAQGVIEYVKQKQGMSKNQDEAVRSNFNQLFCWINENPENANMYFKEIVDNKHWLYNDEEIAQNMKKAEKYDELLKKYNIQDSRDLEKALKVYYQQSENVVVEEVEISEELMVQYGISSMEEFTKARELNIFKENFVHVSEGDQHKFDYVKAILERSKNAVFAFLETLPEYDVSEPINLTNTIFIIKKYGKEMVLITRPSDYEQVILYYGAEKDILDFEKDYELWVEDGKTTPQQITFGKMLKLTGINRIPLRKVV